MEDSTAMMVAKPNNTSVNPIWRSRITDWSSVRVSPRMLYSPVCAIVSVGGVMRDRERFLNEATKSDSGIGSGDADIRSRSLAEGWCGDGPTWLLPESGDVGFVPGSMRL